MLLNVLGDIKVEFGSMGECLTCMEEIKKGRCTIDLRKNTFPLVLASEKILGSSRYKGYKDECWIWQGATRKNNTESTAYFPSPFHAAKTQSAPRVAFWLSRGYTGRYRIFSKPTCKAFCCNPEHLTIKELKNFPDPQLTEDIRLSHDNIFEYYREKETSKQDS